jgi:hypothetical protein
MDTDDRIFGIGWDGNGHLPNIWWLSGAMRFAPYGGLLLLLCGVQSHVVSVGRFAVVKHCEVRSGTESYGSLKPGKGGRPNFLHRRHVAEPPLA